MATQSIISSVVKRVALVAALAVSAVSAQAQTFESMAGTWWLKIAGTDRGALLIRLDEPNAAAAQVIDVSLGEQTSFGFSRELGSFFSVAAGQWVDVDSKGRISGMLVLSDPNSGMPLGNLTIDGGGARKSLTRLTLTGKIESTDGVPRRVKLDGRRFESSSARVTGSASTGKLSGRGIAKGHLSDLAVEVDSSLGQLAYSISGAGAAEVDGLEVPDLSIAGRVMLSPDGQLHGLLDGSSSFGPADLAGALSAATGNKPPKLKLELRGERAVKIRAELSATTIPLVSVTPESFDFGAVALGAAVTQTFWVSNTGHGALSGAAAFTAGSGSGFSLVGPSTYGPLRRGDAPVPVTVRFAPSQDNLQSAALEFSASGGSNSAFRMLSGSGPTVPLLIRADQGIHSLLFRSGCPAATGMATFTVQNPGTEPFEGLATVDGPETIAFDWDANSGAAIKSMPVQIAASASTAIPVRVKCGTWFRRAHLNLVGPGGTSIGFWVGFSRVQP